MIKNIPNHSKEVTVTGITVTLISNGRSVESWADEKARAIYNANLTKIKIFGQLELLGFLGILTCMILMRFGY